MDVLSDGEDENEETGATTDDISNETTESIKGKWILLQLTLKRETTHNDNKVKLKVRQ